MPERGQTHDLATLNILDENTLLDELRVRYSKDIIYTYIGDILVAINPFKPLPIYTPQISSHYVNLKYRNSMRPHIFAVADKAFQALKRSGTSQCCVISGESGAGKTESTKFLVEHIATHCRSHVLGLQEKIIQVNPLLEAFGNAQTVMNNNSSRFGKFIELKFTKDGRVGGAAVNHYLLEKSRVIHQGLNEKNFHIFYYMFAGLTKEELLDLFLVNPEKHRILNSGRTVKQVFSIQKELLYCQKKYDELQQIFNLVGFTIEEVSNIFNILSLVLQIPDIDFDIDTDTDGSYIVDEYILKVVSNLLGVDTVELATVLISTISYVNDEQVISLKNLEQANDARDSLAKALYERLFSWIVWRVNNLLEPPDEVHTDCHIGLLDIFGFENFKHNSFEQLCINIVNEQLQYFFNQNIFAWEMQEYETEGILNPTVQYTNNRGLLELFMGRPVGILSLLDEESSFPQANDDTLVQKFTSHFKRNPYYGTPSMKRQGTNIFNISHYAGQVIYNARGFLEKNRDSLNRNMMELMQKSENDLVGHLFSAEFGKDLSSESSIQDRKAILLCPQPPDRKRASKKIVHNRAISLSKAAGRRLKNQMKKAASGKEQNYNQPKTVSTYFKNSLTKLMDKLLESEPQFVRCIKPNHHKQPYRFQQDVITDQLRYTGLLETIKIRHGGYPTRLSFIEFIRRYKFLFFPLTAIVEPTALNCYQLLQQSGLTNWEIGKTKVFLKYWHTEQLESLLDSNTERVVRVQKVVRGKLARIKLRRLRQQYWNQASQSKLLMMSVQQHSERFYSEQRHSHHIDMQRERQRQEEQEQIFSAKQALLLAQQAKNIYIEEKRDHYPQHQQFNYSSSYEESIASSNQPHSTNSARNSFGSPIPVRQTVNSYNIQKRLLADTLEKLPTLDIKCWCRLYVMEKDQIVKEFNIASQPIIVDSSHQQIPGRIGLGTLENPYRDAQTAKVRAHVGKGLELKVDPDGNLLATRLSKNEVFAKGAFNPDSHCLSGDVVKKQGHLYRNKPAKVFDVDEFRANLALSADKAQTSENPDVVKEKLQMLSLVSLSFVKDTIEDAFTPCWICVAFLPAIRMDNPKIVKDAEKLMNSYRVAAEIKRKKETPTRPWAKTSSRQAESHTNLMEGGKNRREKRRSAQEKGHAPYSWHKSSVEVVEENGESESAVMSGADSSFYESDSGGNAVNSTSIHREALLLLAEKSGDARIVSSYHRGLPSNVTAAPDRKYTRDRSKKDIESNRKWAKVGQIRREEREKEFENR